MNKEEIQTFTRWQDPTIEDLQKRIDKVIKDLKLTKKHNNILTDKRGNKLIFLDIDHIDYLIKILKYGEDDELKKSN